MQRGRASTTAALVALARAIAHVEPELSRICRDPVARRLLPPKLRALSNLAEQSPELARFQRYVWLGMIDHLAVRTALIDQAVSRAMSQGIDQLVILGAGLDARAHRMGELAEATVFEIDHPDSQRVKQKAASKLPLSARELRYAASDFSDGFSEALARAGHDPKRPSAFIWEGVTMYLSSAAVDASIREMSAQSAPGSVVIVTYVTPRLAYTHRTLGRIGAKGLGALSEPVTCAMEPQEMARRFRAHGLTRASDHVPGQAAGVFGVTLGLWARLLPDEHVAVFHKD